MQIISIDINDLIFDPVNARKHSNKNLDAIKGSLTKFGQQKPIVIDDKNIVLAGNGTLAAAKDLGWKTISVVRSDLKGNDKVGFSLADNRTAELAEWDDEALNKHLAALDLSGFDIESIGFDLNDIEQTKEGLTDDDDIPEVAQNEFGVQLGDIWQLGEHRLMCADSTVKENVERLMNGEKADMVFTDPPYGVGYKYNSHDDEVTEDQHYKFLCALMADPCSYATSGRWVITPGCYNLAAMCKARKDFSHIGCWTKTNAMSSGRVTHFWTWEPIFFYGKFKRKRANDVFNYPVGKQLDTGNHTCPKPLALWVDIVENFSEQQEKILDLFLGSGSTLIACEKTNRKCYGMEIDPHYCSVIIKRWQDYAGKKAIKL